MGNRWHRLQFSDKNRCRFKANFTRSINKYIFYSCYFWNGMKISLKRTWNRHVIISNDVKTFKMWQNDCMQTCVCKFCWVCSKYILLNFEWNEKQKHTNKCSLLNDNASHDYNTLGTQLIVYLVPINRTFCRRITMYFVVSRWNLK